MYMVLSAGGLSMGYCVWQPQVGLRCAKASQSASAAVTAAARVAAGGDDGGAEEGEPPAGVGAGAGGAGTDPPSAPLEAEPPVGETMGETPQFDLVPDGAEDDEMNFHGSDGEIDEDEDAGLMEDMY
jgi:hypothetical protein